MLSEQFAAYSYAAKINTAGNWLSPSISAIPYYPLMTGSFFLIHQ